MNNKTNMNNTKTKNKNIKTQTYFDLIVTLRTVKRDEEVRLNSLQAHNVHQHRDDAANGPMLVERTALLEGHAIKDQVTGLDRKPQGGQSTFQEYLKRLLVVHCDHSQGVLGGAQRDVVDGFRVHMLEDEGLSMRRV